MITSKPSASGLRRLPITSCRMEVLDTLSTKRRRRVESESECDARNGAKDCLYVSYYLPLASGYAMRPSWLFSCQYLTSPSVLPWHAHHPESLQFGSSALTNICAALEVESVQADVCSHQAQPPGTPAGAMVGKCDTCKTTSRTCKSQPSQELPRRSVSLGLLKFLIFLSCRAHGQPAPMFRAGGACLYQISRRWLLAHAGPRRFRCLLLRSSADGQSNRGIQ